MFAYKGDTVLIIVTCMLSGRAVAFETKNGPVTQCLGIHLHTSPVDIKGTQKNVHRKIFSLFHLRMKEIMLQLMYH